jgi:predicted nucleic acid-binding protein
MLNLLLVNERRGRLDAKSFEAAKRALTAIPIEFDFDVDEGALTNIAKRHRLTAYNAAYLELALRLGCPLTTLDSRLAKAGSAEGVPLLGATKA